MNPFFSKVSLILFIACLTLIQCSTKDNSKRSIADPSIGQNRPMEPWVFRSVLDKKPRMLTLAMNKDLFIAYDTKRGSLYKAWKGDVDLDGAVYTTYHGPQPTSIGDDYFINEYPDPWTVYADGKLITSELAYGGHKFDDGEVTLMYSLKVGDQVIQIEEAPRFRKTGAGFNVFERRFTVKDIPESYDLILQTNYGSLLDGNQSMKTNGQWYKGAEVPKDNLKLNKNETTTLTLMLGSPTLVNNKPVVNNKLSAAQKLINANDCRSCHNEKVKTVGPSYKAIAEKYPNTAANIAMLAGKIKHGSKGVWGESVMTAHPEISEADLETMMQYIMDLDAKEEAIKANLLSNNPISVAELRTADKSVTRSDLSPGLVTDIYTFEGDKNYLTELTFDKVEATDILDRVDMTSSDFGAYQEKFAFIITGYLKVDQSKRVILRIASDDGSKLYLGDELIIDNDGLHGTQARDAKVALETGFHPFKIEFFENGGGQSLFFQWRTEESGEFVSVPSTALFHKTRSDIEKGKVFAAQSSQPGDGIALAGVHPSYTISQARPDDFEPKVGGLDFLSDGRAVVSTWDALGAVYLVDGVSSGKPEKMKAKRIASGLAEPLGVKVVNDVIYIMQKQEMTKLVDSNGDDYIDEYQVLSNDWDVTANFHEFGFGLDYKDGHFYATLATGIQPGGASALNQPKHRGSVIKVAEDNGATEIVANGLRTPNGVGVGTDNEIFVADNEGDWLPSSKIVHVTKDAWFGSRSVDFDGTAGLKEKKPVVWLPQNEIGNSPTSPTYINDGPYKGQMLHGEVTHGGVKRVFVEKVNGEYQGCVFRFSQGIEAGVNRLRWGPDGALYVGGVGSTGNWAQDRKLWFGLQRLEYNRKSTFEMLSVSARSNGIEIEFTEALADSIGNNPGDYEVKQWYYLPTENYGGPKLDEQPIDIYSVIVSDDRKKVFLQLKDMKENHLIYVHLDKDFKSNKDQSLWTTEGWYTMNNIPKDLPGPTPVQDATMNVLTEQEKTEGWKLLFDGKTTKGWRNFNKEGVGSSWKVINGELTLLVTKRPDGAWQAADGGDIITEDTYENYELKLEWKVADCGNSGLIYNVHEGGGFDYVWQTGPEMQILDNKCHPDATIKTHRAGDLYDMISCSEETVKPSNNWNQVRLVVNKGKVEHWLNGTKVVSFEMFTPKWAEMIANSKFSSMEGFGTYRRGHISLQDHGDRVAFRNIKIRAL